MRTIYRGHDGFADLGTFHSWVMSAQGVKRIYNSVRPNLDATSIYRFHDATISYFGSGDHKDGALVRITIEGDTKITIDEICASIEKNFPRLGREG